MDVPVTAIDEVLEDYEQSMTDCEAVLQRTTQKTREGRSSSQSSGVVQNTNNNARPSEGHSEASSVKPLPLLDADSFKIPEGNPNTKAYSTEKEKQKALMTKTEMELRREKEMFDTKPTTVHSNDIDIPESTPNHLSSNHSELGKEGDGVPIYRGHATRKITHSPVSRFGMKTFTVVPPKPTVSPAQKHAITLTAGAIKIDDQGNMVKVGIHRNKFGGLSESGISMDMCHLPGKAKDFWSSTEKQEASVISKGPSMKTTEPEVLKISPISAPELAEKAKPKESTKDVLKIPEERVEAESMTDKRDLSFLKPSRRTSSQYVASAISKYTAKPQVTANNLHNIPGFSCPNVVRSIQVTPHQSSQITVSILGKESGSIVLESLPEKSMIHPDSSTERQVVSRELKQGREGFISVTALSPGGRSAKSLESVTVTSKPVQPGSPTIAPKQTILNPVSNSFYDQTTAPQSIKETSTSITTPTLLALDKKPECFPPAELQVPSGVLRDPQQASMFGPVKKFKPVILKSVQKETSVHSTLMEAIQNGGGKERLRKISGSCVFAEEENERSALLAAIRDASNSGRLRMTKSEAAVELVKLKKTEVERHAPFDRRPSPPTSLPFSTSPSPPMMPPPPPPPPPSQPKPSLVGESGGNLAMARQAMLEAIRSGSPAKCLKKITAPTKTVQVNGKLGTIQATFSFSQGQ